ncbi:MAG: hypothetical protein L3K03_03040 [Thermoplasmata archaeon]|nr:hypothetical protein [Thermoplasmata archaeon]
MPSDGVPPLRLFSATMRVDALLADWRGEAAVERDPQLRERRLYGSAWNAYLEEGDYGFGLWCWHECDRLQNALGSVREVTRVLGNGRYLGFSHRRVIAEKLPMERVYRPRKGDMSTPRTDAIIPAGYQVLCAYAVRAQAGDRRAAAELEIALTDYEDRRREDPFRAHFETFRKLLDRQREPSAASSAPAP